MFNTSENVGGAAKSAYRLHQGLRSNGIESTFIVQNKSSESNHIIGPSTKWQNIFSIIRPRLDQIPISFSIKNGYHFSTAWFPSNLQHYESYYDEAQVVHLHWINKGFIQIEHLRNFSKPVIWTLHDMWPFTGGCHHSFGCDQYKFSCGSCPHLSLSHPRDITHRIWQRKYRAWKNLDITLVGPSKWITKKAKQSSLFSGKPIKTIANGIDLTKFSPENRNLYRNRIGLTADRRIILFSAMNMTKNPYKGFGFIKSILAKLHDLGWENKLELALLGATELQKDLESFFSVNYLGELKDELSLSIIYSSVDLYFSPSIIDNLPNTIIESLASGTPCVAFNVGGIPDQIDHKENGYLAKPYDEEDIAIGIDWILQNDERWNLLSKNARLKAEINFDIIKQTGIYVDLYKNKINQTME